jgi:hypothetical protein
MFTHIRAASLTLRAVLERSFRADPDLAQLFDPAHGNAVVSLATPDGMETAGEIGLSMWLYRIIRDEQTLNRPPRRIPPDLVLRQPLPVRAHYLMTPIVTGNAGKMPAPETEQLIIGRVLQTFHDEPQITAPDLAGSYRGHPVQLTARLETLGLDETSRIWEGLERSYQLSVSYEVTIVVIASGLQPQAYPPVLIAEPQIAIGAPGGGG